MGAWHSLDIWARGAPVKTKAKARLLLVRRRLGTLAPAVGRHQDGALLQSIARFDQLFLVGYECPVTGRFPGARCAERPVQKLEKIRPGCEIFARSLHRLVHALVAEGAHVIKLAQ